LQDLEKESEGRVGSFSKARYEDLLNKKQHCLSSIHPDTGELIPWFARTSAFIPVNIPIICGMMLSSPTMFNTILW